MCGVLLFQPTHLANFTQVQSIQYSCMEERERKGMLQLDVAGAAEVTRRLWTSHIKTHSKPRAFSGVDYEKNYNAVHL